MSIWQAVIGETLDWKLPCMLALVIALGETSLERDQEGHSLARTQRHLWQLEEIFPLLLPLFACTCKKNIFI